MKQTNDPVSSVRFSPEWEKEYWYSQYNKQFNPTDMNLKDMAEQNQKAQKQAEPWQDAAASLNMGSKSVAGDFCPPENFFPAKDRVGEIRAEFLDFTYPNYGFRKHEMYNLELYTNGKEVAIREIGKHNSATYQSWTEFLKNWGSVTYVNPEDRLIEEIKRLMKSNAATSEELGNMYRQLQELKDRRK